MTARAKALTEVIQAQQKLGFLLVADLPSHKRLVWTAPVVELKR